MTWAGLFERTADLAVDVEDVQAALATRREEATDDG